MRELSLFAGAGGGLLGTRLLGWRPVGYVEINTYCQKIIAARIKDGILPDAPIFGDIRAFICEGYAKAYQGMVDIVTAGFPCQPFSGAGKQLGAADERNLWPETIECIRIVRPRYALLENVAVLTTDKYFGTILGDLAESGYDSRWRVLSAAELGAPHKRDRVWIVSVVADTDKGKRKRGSILQKRQKSGARGCIRVGSEENTDTHNGGCKDEKNVPLSDRTLSGRSNTTGLHCQTVWQGGSPVEPAIRRVVDGLADWVDRIEAIGNGQVPAVVRSAWLLLNASETAE